MASTPPSSSDTSASADAETGTASGPSFTPAFSPLYQQIKVLMLQSLQSGEWKPSAAIPSELELAARAHAVTPRV